MGVRTLRLRTERLAELTPDDLAAVVGAEVSGVACLTGPDRCAASRIAASLCGCLSNYCSIDVC